ncbi:hypothetical protein ACVWW4_000920 [Bradyrhizobium sp. LB7.1]
MLVDELRVTVAPKQQTEIVEPGHDALELHSVDQKDRQWRFSFANVIKEGVLPGFVRGLPPFFFSL